MGAIDFSWILTFLIGIITYLVVRYYLKVKSLPPGPLPFPLLGNLLSFRKRTVTDVLQQFRKKYGSIFTVWLGQVPYVVLTDLPEIKEAMLERRTDFAGRGNLHSIKVFLDGNTSIADSDFSKASETLRKMANLAVRKYTLSEKLPLLVDSIAEESVEYMLQEKEPFDPKYHIHHLLSNYIASSLFGKRYERNDPEFLTFRNVAEILNEEFGKGFISDYIPFLRLFSTNQEERMRKATKNGISIVHGQLTQHMKSYEAGVVRDVIDSLLSAREETISEGKESAVYMNDMNMVYAIFDLYFASIETTTITIRWIFMFLASYPHIQEKVIQELQDVLGDRLAVQEDRKLCHFTIAVIYEILRCRTTVPFLLPHRSTCDSKIGGYQIAKGTIVLVCADMVHKNSDHWNEPEAFKPERFLLNESFVESRLEGHLPFGQGRRNCIGEKLAIIQIFLVLAKIFRKCRIIMKTPPKDMNPEEKLILFSFPKEYKIICKPLS